MLQNKRRLTIIGSGLIGIFLAMQVVHFFVPIFKRENPPAPYSVNWDAPQTAALWNTACADCHSNHTDWRWYTQIAPVAWLVAYDVNVGREELNVSTDPNPEAGEMIESIQNGEMPPSIYTITHPDANLSAAEKDQLIVGIRATFR